MKEEWETIEEYGGRYSISNFGNIKNNKTGKIAKVSMCNNAVFFNTKFNNLRIKIYPHREVLKYFLNINPQTPVYHKDGNRFNNSVGNLIIGRIKNKYKEMDKYFIIYTDKNEEFKVDKEDFEKVIKYKWYKSSDNYICSSSLTKSQGIGIKLSHLILPCSKTIDHINHDRTDNRKCNLRICTISENNRNQSISKNNTSGFIGVSKGNITKKYGQTWRAQIRYNNKYISLGTFHNIEDAVKARLQAEKECFREFAPQQHLFKEYEIE